MRRIIRICIALTLLFTIATLLLIFQPRILYSSYYDHGDYRIFHNSKTDNDLLLRLDEAQKLIQSSEFYSGKLKMDICLNEGSAYPAIIKALRGSAFAWGFYNKVVLLGNADCKNNFVELNNYKWNMTALLAHEMIHCIQYDHLGFRHSKPFADIPEWKWEGYAEYISRKSGSSDLKNNIEIYLRSLKQSKDEWAIAFSDGTVAPREYFRYQLLVQYCLDIKSMSYEALLKDNSKEEVLMEEMLRYFNTQNLVLRNG